MKLNKVVNFFKSKSVVDVVYLVMMILIVTMIKDMIVSMYKKRKDKQWLNQAFGKTKGGKNVEGFTAGWTTTDCGSATGDTASVCDRLKFLLCDSNFHILKKYIDADLINIKVYNGTTYYRLNTKGGNIYTMSGGIYTNKLRTGGIHTNNETPIEFDSLNFNPTSGQKGGDIVTGGGHIFSYGGDIGTERNDASGWMDINGGDIYTGGGNIKTYGGNIDASRSVWTSGNPGNIKSGGAVLTNFLDPAGEQKIIIRQPGHHNNSDRYIATYD